MEVTQPPPAPWLTESYRPRCSFAAFAAEGGDGRERLRAVTAEAEEAGVFGVPSYVWDGELRWGPRCHSHPVWILRVDEEEY